MTDLKLYHDLADWFTLLTHPVTDDYESDAAGFVDAIEATAQRPVRDVLLLGAGAGNVAGFLKERYRVTLTDISPEMLDVARAAHPECEFVVGDMRTLRLKRTFDAVLAEDALEYITEEADLRKVAATALAHLRAGGAAIFAPDETRETFHATTEAGGNDGQGGRAMRYLEWKLPPKRGATWYSAFFVYVMREPRKPMRVEWEEHRWSLYPRATWERVIAESGLEFVSYAESPVGGVIFSARKPPGSR